MRDVSSEFWAALQEPGVLATDFIDVAAPNSTYRWVATNQELVNSGNTYEPFPGTNPSGIEEASDLSIAVIDFVISNSGSFFTPLAQANQLDKVDVTIRRGLINSPDLGMAVFFRGNVGEYCYNRMTVAGRARNAFDAVDIKFPPYTYMNNCAWRFGSPPCSFDTTSITVVGSILSVSSGNLGVTLNSGDLDAFSDGDFNFGRFTFTDGVSSGQVRTIRIHIGEELLFSHPVPFTPSAGDLFSIFPGCRKRLVEDCISRYNNSSNFLGFPWIIKQEQAF